MSSERGKFGEPWTVGKEHRSDLIDDSSRYPVLSLANHVTGLRAAAVLNRAVDCVNAFDGTEDPAAELARLRAIEAAARVMAVSLYGVHIPINAVSDLLALRAALGKPR